MKMFQILLVAMTIAIITITGIVSNTHGWNLIEVFIDNIISLNWSGQFNFDFMCYLFLSAIWIMWRHDFSPMGIVLGLIASVAGILFFAPYLFILTIQSNGNITIVLLGKKHSNNSPIALRSKAE
ncbi:MAG: hypothetical protein H7A24_03965 [Leptospiraceae bacterium]|nr:hypothetical protein [Leptospiraceae bacterium]MCP5511009.1 hypothetical protein [Leptospiraceae bacterium]